MGSLPPRNTAQFLLNLSLKLPPDHLGFLILLSGKGGKKREDTLPTDSNDIRL